MKTWENANMVICGSNRWQKIKYTRGEGEEPSSPYVRYRNQRIMLDEFMTSPHNFEEESKLCGMEIHAAAGTSYFSAHLIHINKEGDQVKVFFSYNR